MGELGINDSNEVHKLALASVSGMDTPVPEGELSIEEAVSRLKFLERDVELIKTAYKEQTELNKITLKNINLLIELYQNGSPKKATGSSIPIEYDSGD